MERGTCRVLVLPYSASPANQVSNIDFTSSENPFPVAEQLATAPTSKKRKRAPGPIDQVLGDIIELTYADARVLAEPSRMGALEL